MSTFGYPGDFIKETSTTTTTGALQLPNVATFGNQTWDNWFSTGQRVNYIAKADTVWEIGVGVYDSPSHSISRDYRWWSSSSGAAIDFTGLTVDIYTGPIGMGGSMIIQNHILNASIAPIVTDDTATGYDIGNVWIVPATPDMYICFDPSPSAAVWGRLLTSLTKMTQPATMTTGGTTGAQTINKPSGSVNFAASATSLVVTNSLVSTSSILLCQVMTNDTTMKSVQAVAGSGSFTLYANAAATAETKVAFLVIN